MGRADGNLCLKRLKKKKRFCTSRIKLSPRVGELIKGLVTRTRISPTPPFLGRSLNPDKKLVFVSIGAKTKQLQILIAKTKMIQLQPGKMRNVFEQIPLKIMLVETNFDLKF